MNNSVLLSLLLVGISVLSQVDAHWGWGGFPGAGGWGRPWGGYYGGNNGWARPLLYEANPYEVQDVYARTYGYRGRRDATEMTGIECIYSSRIGSMNCNNGTVVCNTKLMMDGMPTNFDMFGISYINNLVRLYPKMYTENNFGDYMIGNVGLTMFTTGTQGKGLLIEDLGCFNQMIELFKGVTSPLMVNNGAKTQIPIYGFVLGHQLHF